MVNSGAMAMSLAALITLDNVLPVYVEDDDRLNEIFREIEKDLQEVWDEAVNEGAKGHADDIAELLIGHAEAIRKKRGMDVL